MNPISLIIPAYKPNQKLIELIQKCLELNISIIIVNDGSGKNFESIFTELEKMKVKILYHKNNQGKGNALKTGFRYWKEHQNSDNSLGVITADADGQHSFEDIKKIINTFQHNPDCLIVGNRTFQERNVPWRSRFGNKLTRFIFQKFLRMNINDTQSGLRGIPAKLVLEMLLSKAERYEFELEMLLYAKKLGIQIKECPIATIYIDNNAGSHFNPLIDSFRIYFVFIRFASVSIISALIDFLIFIAMFHISKTIFFAVLTGRVVSGTVNFSLNKQFAFRLSNNLYPTVIKYLSLVIILMFAAYYLISFFHRYGVNIYVSKILAESILYIISFLAQNYFVFKRHILIT